MREEEAPKAATGQVLLSPQARAVSWDDPARALLGPDDWLAHRNLDEILDPAGGVEPLETLAERSPVRFTARTQHPDVDRLLRATLTRMAGPEERLSLRVRGITTSPDVLDEAAGPRDLGRLVDELPVGLYRTTPSGRVLYANATLVEMLGLDDRTPLIDRDLEAEAFEPAYPRETFRERLEEQGQVQGLEARWTREDGETIVVRETARAVHDEDGRVRYYEGVVEDVTETVETERRLETNQLRLEALLRLGPLTLFALDDRGRLNFLEGADLEALGLDRDIQPGHPLEELEFVDEATERTVQHALDGIPGKTELHVGGRWLEADLVPVPDERSLEDAVIGVLVDVTDRREAKQAVFAAQNRLEAVIERAPIILSLLGPDGEIRYVGGAGLEGLELDRASLIGQNPLEMDMSVSLQKNIERALEGEAFTETIQVAGRWLKVESVPLEDEEGKLKEVLRVGTDVTEQIRARYEARRLNETLERRVRERTAELEAANEELRSLTRSLAHDLRGPLQTVDGYAGVLLEDHGSVLDDHARALVERIREATETTNERIEALSSLSRVTQRTLEFDTVDLSEVARRVLDRLRERDPDREVTTKVADGLEVRADPDLAEILFENLLENAWKFTRDQESARIVVEPDPEASQPVIRVRDNGTGFPPDRADQLFEPFERVSRTSVEGTGIGLATVRRIVDRHGGWIEAESPEDEGATFRVQLGEAVDG